MALARTDHLPDGAPSALAYGASALVTLAAAISAAPVYLTPAFVYFAAGLIIIGTPVSVYLRAVNANRRLLNLGMVGISLVFIVMMLRDLQLPRGETSLLRLALYMDGRVALAFLIQTFVTVAMFRSFTLLTDRDLTLSIVPALSSILLAAILVRGPFILVGIVVFFVGAFYLLAVENQDGRAATIGAAHILDAHRRRRLLVGVTVRVSLLLTPLVAVAALAFARVNLPRMIMREYVPALDFAIALRIRDLTMPGAIVPATSITMGDGQPSSSRVLFRVVAPDSALWRTTMFDQYLGRNTPDSPFGFPANSWRNQDTVHYRTPLVKRGREWPAPAQDPGLRAGVPSRPLRQQFRLEALLQGAMLAAYEPQAFTGSFHRPRISDASVVIDTIPLPAGASYRVISQRKIPPGVAAYRSNVSLSAAERRRYLALPAIPARTRRLALDITKRERDDLRRALALSGYLRSHFDYRARVSPPPPDRDGVDYFLHHMKGGYCTYFASALAVMARLNHLPARVVVGYRSDEEDPQTGEWIVREKHAHSWTEVFIDRYGWLEMDATPTAESQATTIETIQTWLSDAWSGVKRTVSAPFIALAAHREWWWQGLAALAGLALVGLGVRYLLSEKVPPLPREGDDEQLRRYVRRCYGLMCKWLGKWGWPKAAGVTASEYAADLTHRLGAAATPMRGIIETYLHVEYGGDAPRLEQARGIAGGLSAVRRMRRALTHHAQESSGR